MGSLRLPCPGMRCRRGGLGCGEFVFGYVCCWAILILDRYNTFYVLYPIGITSECTLIYQALGPAAGIDPLFRYFLIAVLVIYVPGASPASGYKETRSRC